MTDTRTPLARPSAVAVAALLLIACRDTSPVARVRVRERVVHLRNGFCSPITLEWNLLRPLEKQQGRAVVFLHLIDRPNHVFRTFDHPLPMTWNASPRHTYRVDLCQSLLAPALRDGHYALSIGLYDAAWGYRWPLDTVDGDEKRREYRIVPVVASGAHGIGSIAFRGAWGPVSMTGDRQVVARREIRGPVTIAMLEPKAERIHLTIGVRSRAPTIVTSSCDADFPHVLPTGVHTLDLTACRAGQIRIVPADGFSSLESVAWTGPPAASSR